jgi:hypothetical protein
MGMRTRATHHLVYTLGPLNCEVATEVESPVKQSVEWRTPFFLLGDSTPSRFAGPCVVDTNLQIVEPTLAFYRELLSAGEVFFGPVFDDEIKDAIVKRSAFGRGDQH